MTIMDKHLSAIKEISEISTSGDLVIDDFNFSELSQKNTTITKEYMKGFAEWMWNENWIGASAIIPTFSHIGSSKRFKLDELIELYLKENKL